MSIFISTIYTNRWIDVPLRWPVILLQIKNKKIYNSLTGMQEQVIFQIGMLTEPSVTDMTFKRP